MQQAKVKEYYSREAASLAVRVATFRASTTAWNAKYENDLKWWAEFRKNAQLRLEKSKVVLSHLEKSIMEGLFGDDLARHTAEKERESMQLDLNRHFLALSGAYLHRSLFLQAVGLFLTSSTPPTQLLPPLPYVASQDGKIQFLEASRVVGRLRLEAFCKDRLAALEKEKVGALLKACQDDAAMAEAKAVAAAAAAARRAATRRASGVKRRRQPQEEGATLI